MAFLGRQLLKIPQKSCGINNVINSFRSLRVSPSLLQNMPSIGVPIASNTVSLSEIKECREVFDKVNQQLAVGNEGRLFAVVHLCGKQFKITTGDIILVEGYWPPTIGDEIRLEKVLLAGARDFTLVGRPTLEPGLVNIKATIIEKTLTHTKTHFKKKRRKQYLRINFQRSPNTMIRINSIEVARNVDLPMTNVDEKRLF